jgi:hypothetical protein
LRAGILTSVCSFFLLPLSIHFFCHDEAQAFDVEDGLLDVGFRWAWVHLFVAELVAMGRDGDILSLRLRLNDGLRQSGWAFGPGFLARLKGVPQSIRAARRTPLCRRPERSPKGEATQSLPLLLPLSSPAQPP